MYIFGDISFSKVSLGRPADRPAADTQICPLSSSHTRDSVGDFQPIEVCERSCTSVQTIGLLQSHMHLSPIGRWSNKELGSASVTTKFWQGSISSRAVADEMRPSATALLLERSVGDRTPQRTGRQLRCSDIDASVRDRRYFNRE